MENESRDSDPSYLPSVLKKFLSRFWLQTPPTWSLERGHSEVKVYVRWDVADDKLR